MQGTVMHLESNQLRLPLSSFTRSPKAISAERGEDHLRRLHSFSLVSGRTLYLQFWIRREARQFQ